MKCGSRFFKFELPDECEWWAAAGMLGFTTNRLHYRALVPSEHTPRILPIDNIEVRSPGAGVAPFDEGHMIRMLQRIRLDHAMQPIHVFSEATSGGRTYVLNDGFHRLAASIAVGFTQRCRSSVSGRQKPERIELQIRAAVKLRS